MKVFTGAGVAALLLAGIVLPAAAEVTITDLQVAARALSFIEQPLTGRVRMGVVYDPDSPRSRQEAEEIEEMLGDRHRVGNVELEPVLIAVGDAGKAVVDLFFLTDYVPAGAGSLGAVIAEKRIPCITTDVEQVKRGACVMAVRSNPKVQIVVNRAAAARSDVTFATVFRVMITEI